jgi:hypothetical protein
MPLMVNDSSMSVMLYHSHCHVLDYAHSRLLLSRHIPVVKLMIVPHSNYLVNLSDPVSVLSSHAKAFVAHQVVRCMIEGLSRVHC